MNIKNKKTISSTIATILILSMALSIIPNVAAQETDIKTYPFVEAIPNPVGVNQPALINFGLLNFLAVDGDGWNVTVTVTDPNGKSSTIGPLKTWSTGTVGQYFTPDIVGNYTLVCNFERVYYNSSQPARAPAGWYAASKTDPYTLVVTEEPTEKYPGQPLPSEYWSRPIDSQLREWWSVAGQWAYKPENLIVEANAAPTTAHILWNTPLGDTSGGLIGGDDLRDHGYQNGDAYEGKFAGSVIINGVLYYNKYVSGAPTQTIVAIDLHTGQKKWENTYSFGGGRISTGQILYWDSLNNRGGFSYIWLASGTTMYAVDAESGILRYNMTNVPSGTIYMGPSGEMLKYSIVNYGNSSNPNYRLLQWNSSSIPKKYGSGYSAESWGSQTQGKQFDATRGYDMNVSLAAYNSAAVGTFPASTANTTIQKAFVNNMVILSSVSYDTVQLWAFSLQEGHEGALLFNKVNAAPSEWKAGFITISSIGQAGWCAWSLPDKVAVFFSKENRVHYAYSLETGAFLWETEPQVYSDAWSDTVLAGFGPDRVIAYNKLYSATVGGIVYCYDICDGSLLWEYDVKDKYGESYLTNNWWMIPLFVSQDKIYLGTLEHSALDPKPRGGPFLCLNAQDGSVVFEADGLFRQTRWGGRAIMGDSIIVTQDTYDQQIYAIGKGPSAMTVTAPDVAVAANTPVLIKGTITDISPGTASAALKLRFPNGVPVVSDESMSEWMLYVYKQFSQPMDTTGVAISIDAVDPNGNYIHLGDTTSDASGRFSLQYVPENAGQYTIYATFAGSAAYYSSYAQTAMVVAGAAATPTPTTQSTVEQMFVPAVGAIIAVVVIMGILLALLLLRKH